MSTLSPHLRVVLKDAFDRLRNGELKTLIPFLSLFRLSGKPMNLRLHYQFAPLFNTTQPNHLVMMCGRQLGKSYSICADTALRNMLIPFYHTLIIQPRADQIQRLINTVYKPLLNSCPVVEEFITSVEAQKMALRQFKNGSMCYAEHIYQNPDRVRGISGVASCIW